MVRGNEIYIEYFENQNNSMNFLITKFNKLTGKETLLFNLFQQFTQQLTGSLQNYFPGYLLHSKYNSLY